MLPTLHSQETTPLRPLHSPLMFSTRESSWQSPQPGTLASRVKLLRDTESPARQLMNPLSRGGNQSAERASTKLKVMPGLLTAAPLELVGCWGGGRCIRLGSGCPGRAEALASTPWLGNNIVPRTRWGQCLEVNKIFIVWANSHSHLMNNGIYRLAEADPAGRRCGPEPRGPCLL